VNSIEIYTITAQLIQRRIYHETKLVQMQLTQPKGMYFVKIINDEAKKAVFKLIKE
jgi:hypothetical protein